MKAKVLVIPVFQKYWLYHAWSDTVAGSALSDALPRWTEGASLQEKAQLLGKEVNTKVQSVAQTQWKSLEAADEGTFKNKLYKLARWVLSREDPTETFLKSLPKDLTSIEVMYPAGMKERLVRRRMRRMALAQEHFHNRRILGWALATIPQLPLMITPLPNVTLYYCAYKVYSHYQAVQGCRTLGAAFRQYDELERERQRERLARPAALRLLPFLSGGGAGRGAGGKEGGEGRGPVPVFRSSRALEREVRSLDRWQSPLPDAACARLRRLYGPGAEPLPELVARLRAQVLEGRRRGGSSLCGEGRRQC